MGKLTRELPIHQISLPTPWRALGPIHIYLVRQDPVTLVDAGLNTPESREALLAGLAELGLGVRDIKRILLTHAHIDHFGQAGWIAERAGAEVYLHPEEAAKLETPGWWMEIRDQVLYRAGVDRESLELIEQAWQLGRQTCLPLQGWRPLADGQRFSFEGGALQAIHLPGHALGHTGFYEETSRRLIGGDHLLEGVTPNPILEPVQPGHPDAVPHEPVRALTLGQFLRSLERVAALDVDRVLPGHGPVITDHRGVVAHYQARHARRLTGLLERLSEGLSPWALTRSIYPKVRGFDLFLALSEILAHLDLLVVQGRAVFKRTGDRNQYWPG